MQVLILDLKAISQDGLPKHVFVDNIFCMEKQLQNKRICGEFLTSSLLLYSSLTLKNGILSLLSIQCPTPLTPVCLKLYTSSLIPNQLVFFSKKVFPSSKISKDLSVFLSLQLVQAIVIALSEAKRVFET